VAASEQYADGLAGAKELRPVRTAAHSAWARIGPLQHARYAAAELAHDACWLDPMLLREGLAVLRRLAGRGLAIPVALLRDLLGNPFRPVRVDPAWLRWNDGAVVQLARAAHDDRSLPSGELDRQRLLVLADALEEAGCCDPVIPDHCRQPGEHYRGCFVVDALLGKT
jgi:hypothetical protein